MVRHSWIRKLFVPTPRTIRKVPARRRPSVELLEDRFAPATAIINVTSNLAAPNYTDTTVMPTDFTLPGA